MESFLLQPQAMLFDLAPSLVISVDPVSLGCVYVQVHVFAHGCAGSFAKVNPSLAA